MDKCLNSSKKMDWGTPQFIYDQLDAEFGFNVDVCAHELNHKCFNYFTEDDDGLSLDWVGTCWMNPPYGREIGKWVQKAYEESLRGATVVCLIPSRTDTKYWHDYVMKAAEIRLVKGRIKFEGCDHCPSDAAPFPSAIIVFKHTDKPVLVSGYVI